MLFVSDHSGGPGRAISQVSVRLSMFMHVHTIFFLDIFPYFVSHSSACSTGK